VSTATETAGHVVRPVSRSRVFWRSPLGRVVKRAPFYLLVVFVFVYALFPFAWALRCAFTPESDLFSSPLQYVPDHPTLDNFKQAFQAEFFRKALLNSALVAGGVTLLSLAIGALAAFALGRFRFRGRSFVMYQILTMTNLQSIAKHGAHNKKIYGFSHGPIQ
jgi:trehalose/maltose transport system permease protein